MSFQIQLISLILNLFSKLKINLKRHLNQRRPQKPQKISRRSSDCLEGGSRTAMSTTASRSRPSSHAVGSHSLKRSLMTTLPSSRNWHAAAKKREEMMIMLNNWSSYIQYSIRAQAKQILLSSSRFKSSKTYGGATKILPKESHFSKAKSSTTTSPLWTQKCWSRSATSSSP